MKTNRLLLRVSMLCLVMGVPPYSAEAQQQAECGNLAECQALEASLQARLGRVQTRTCELQVHAGGSNFGEIIRRGDRGCPSYQADSPVVCHMSQHRAFESCLNRNPENVREQIANALRYRRHGSGWEFDESLPGGRIPPGSSYLPGLDELGLVKDRYRTCSIRLAGTPAAGGLSAWDLSAHVFWSSSIHPYYSDVAFILNGADDAYVRSDDRGSLDYAVLCMRSP